jgi:hypothetical protein
MADEMTPLCRWDVRTLVNMIDRFSVRDVRVVCRGWMSNRTDDRGRDVDWVACHWVDQAIDKGTNREGMIRYLTYAANTIDASRMNWADIDDIERSQEERSQEERSPDEGFKDEWRQGSHRPPRSRKHSESSWRSQRDSKSGRRS